MASPQLSQSQIDTILQDAGWPENEWGNAYGVIQAESGGEANPTESPASAAAGATGLFQVLAEHWQGLSWFNSSLASQGYSDTEASYEELLTNPTFNAEQALELYEGGGWMPWETDAYISANPELLNAPIEPAAIGPTGPVGPIGPTGSVTTGMNPTTGQVTAKGSGLSSIGSRIVLGLVGIILLAVFASQLLKGDNSPAQVILQGSQNVASHAKRAPKKAVEAAPMVAE